MGFTLLGARARAEAARSAALAVADVAASCVRCSGPAAVTVALVARDGGRTVEELAARCPRCGVT